MNERRSAAQELAQCDGPLDEDLASEVERGAKVAVASRRKYGFKKSPDLPLGEFLERRTEMEASSCPAET